MSDKIPDFDPVQANERIQKAILARQTGLWGELAKDRLKLNELSLEYSALRNKLMRARQVLFKDRQPIPLTPFVISPLYIVRTPELSPGEKLCFLNLIHYAQDRKTAWPSETRQAGDLKITVRQLQRYLKSLVQKGFIMIGFRRVSHTIHVNQYELNIEDNTRERSR